MGVFTFARESMGTGLQVFREGEPAGHAAPLAAAKYVLPVLMGQAERLGNNVEVFFTQTPDGIELRTRLDRAGNSIPALRIAGGVATPADISAFLHRISSRAQRRGAASTRGARHQKDATLNPQ